MATRSELRVLIEKISRGKNINLNIGLIAPIEKIRLKFLFNCLSIFLNRKKIAANFLTISLFKAQQMQGFKKMIFLLRLKFEIFFGKLISFDSFLNLCETLLPRLEKTNNTYVFTTEVDYLYDYILALLKGDKVFVYVYSWDHIYKNVYFSKRVEKYFVWNDQQKNALSSLHDIDLYKIEVVGSTLFGSLYEYKKKYPKKVLLADHNNILLVMSTGTEYLQREELSIFSEIIKLNPEINFYLRPYPFYKRTLVQSLSSQTNFLGLDTDYVKQFQNESPSFYKYRLIGHFNYVVHMGTTLGVEAALLGVKSIFLTNLDDQYSHLRHFLKQSQLKWLETICSPAEVKLRVNDNVTLFDLTQKVISRNFFLRSVDEISNKMRDEIHDA